ncbi:MAG: hypothetical protein WCU80_02325 [Paludibacteraceae bacterium]
MGGWIMRVALFLVDYVKICSYFGSISNRVGNGWCFPRIALSAKCPVETNWIWLSFKTYTHKWSRMRKVLRFLESGCGLFCLLFLLEGNK